MNRPRVVIDVDADPLRETLSFEFEERKRVVRRTCNGLVDRRAPVQRFDDERDSKSRGQLFEPDYVVAREGERS